MKLIEIFKKQGGINLLKQYCRNGSFLTALIQFICLGKSRTALEILRLSTQLKVKQKLKRKYMNQLEEFEKKYDINLSHESSDYVWICWFQGIDSAPEIVKICYHSLKENLPKKKIILITSENMEEYVQFPEFILQKWKNGQITHTHMTDLLRLELLIKYGGMWVDATVYCSQKEDKIPEYYFNSDLFFYQCLKPGRDGHCTYMSSWLISAKSNNKILMATRFLCYEYWKKSNIMLDYFLLHDFMSIVLDYYFEQWKQVIPVDNATPHMLLLRLFDRYDDDIWRAIQEQTPFHKLTYKFKQIETEKQGTFYQKIFTGKILA